MMLNDNNKQIKVSENYNGVLHFQGVVLIRVRNLGSWVRRGGGGD